MAVNLLDTECFGGGRLILSNQVDYMQVLADYSVSRRVTAVCLLAFGKAGVKEKGACEVCDEL